MKKFFVLCSFLFGLILFQPSFAFAACEINNISFSPFTGDIMTTSGTGLDYGKETTLSIETNGECESLAVEIKEQTYSDGESTPSVVIVEDKPQNALPVPSSNTLKILYHTSENQCNGNSWFDCQVYVEITKPNGDVESTKNVIQQIYNDGSPVQPGGLNFGAGVILAECDGFCDAGSYDDPWEYLGSNSPTEGICEIGEAIFTPNGNSSTGSTINVKLLPKRATDCVDKPVLFKIYEYDSFEDNQIDSFWYNQKKLKLDTNGELNLTLRAGEDECEGEDICEYYIEGSVFNPNGFITTEFSTDLGNEKNLPDPYKGRLRYNCNGDCNDRWQVLSISPDNLRGGCTVNNIEINPTGFQTSNDPNAHSFINKTDLNNPKVIVKVETTGCHQNGVPIEIEPYEWKGIDRDAEEVTLETGVKEDGVLNLVYVPGDTDCQFDEGETDGARCDYAFQVDTNSEVEFGDEFYQSEYQADGTGTLAWLCTEPNQCNRTEWKLESHDGVPVQAQGIGTTKPKYDRDSPCWSTDLEPETPGLQEGYDPFCYEFLAPIPGIGQEQIVDGNPTGRFYIENLRGYSLGTYINTIFEIAVAILAVLSVIMIVVAGVQYMTVESIYGKSDAKARIISAVTGLILALGIYTILITINPKLRNINFGEGIKEAQVVIVDDPAELDGDGSSTTVSNAPATQICNNRKDRGYWKGQSQLKLTKIAETASSLPLGSLEGQNILITTGTPQGTNVSKKAEEGFANRVKTMMQTLHSQGITTRITEAFGPAFLGHGSPCHYLGSCIDLATGTSAANATYSVDDVEKIIRAADAAGLTAQFEFSQSQTTDAYESMQTELASRGIDACMIKYVRHATNWHFSVYDKITPSLTL